MTVRGTGVHIVERSPERAHAAHAATYSESPARRWLRRTIALALLPAALASAAAYAVDASPQADSRDPKGELRVGNPIAMRGSATDGMLEQIATIEYRQLISDATSQHRVLAQSDPRVRRVRSIVDALVPYALKWNDRARKWTWEVNVVRSPRLDAYCMPGGKVVIFTGLFDKLRPSDDELAMLIGHEMAHAMRQHARVMLDGGIVSRYRGTLSAPQLFGIGDFDFDSGSGFPDLRYNGDDEREADVIGTEIAARAGFDPRAAVSLWQRVATIDRRLPVELAETHPITPARLVDLQRRQPDMFTIYAKAIGHGQGKSPSLHDVTPATSKAVATDH